MTTLFEKRPGCLSEHTLDRFVLGDSSQKERRTVTAHLERCSLCAEKARVASLGFDAFPAFDADHAIDRLHQMTAGAAPPGWVDVALGTDSPVSESARRSRLRTVTWAGAAIAACVAAVLAWSVIQSPSNTGGDFERVRAKGGLKLEVLRNRNGDVSEALTGERFVDGDQLRFRVSLPGDGYVMVVGVEQDGRIYPCYPIDGSAEKLSAEQDILLPEAVRLDDSRGEEWLYLVLCRAAFNTTTIQTGSQPGTLILPAGCEWDSFEMVKGSP